MSAPQVTPVDRIIHSDPEIMGGVPVFRGTRAPVQTLFDYLADGYDVDEFVDNFPSVARDQAIALLVGAGDLLAQGCLHS
jgi:uncharacterized protein (DUF433 family)